MLEFPSDVHLVRTHVGTWQECWSGASLELGRERREGEGIQIILKQIYLGDN